MTKTIDALVEALEFFVERFGPGKPEYLFSQRFALDKAVAALALARAEQAEPVAGYGSLWPNGNPSRGDLSPEEDCHVAAPVAKLEPLSEDEIWNMRATAKADPQCEKEHWFVLLVRLVEAAHNEKLAK